MREPFDLDQTRARQAAAREQAALDYANPDTTDHTHLQHTAITNCQLCDNDGYRGARVCDHTGRDHYAESANGRALVRAELDKIRNRRTRKATA